MSAEFIERIATYSARQLTKDETIGVYGTFNDGLRKSLDLKGHAGDWLVTNNLTGENKIFYDVSFRCRFGANNPEALKLLSTPEPAVVEEEAPVTPDPAA